MAPGFLVDAFTATNADVQTLTVGVNYLIVIDASFERVLRPSDFSRSILLALCLCDYAVCQFFLGWSWQIYSHHDHEAHGHQHAECDPAIQPVISFLSPSFPGATIMTKPTDDPIASRRRLIAREAVLLPGDPSLRDVIVALVPKGLDLLEVSIGDLATALRGYHKERRAIEAAAWRQR